MGQSEEQRPFSAVCSSVDPMTILRSFEKSVSSSFSQTFPTRPRDSKDVEVGFFF